MSTRKLEQGMCRPLPAGTPPLAEAQIDAGLAQLPGWSYADDAIAKAFAFANYAETIAFVNAVAWIAQREDHHFDMLAGYERRVAYQIHTVGGISGNDFICAAKIEALCRI